MILEMQKQVHQRLTDEAGIHATEDEVATWDVPMLKMTTFWLDALLRRKDGNPFASDTYNCPEHVRVVIRREANA